MSPEDFARMAARLRLDYREASRRIADDRTTIEKLQQAYGGNALCFGGQKLGDGLLSQTRERLRRLVDMFLADVPNADVNAGRPDDATNLAAEERLDVEWAAPTASGVDVLSVHALGFGRTQCGIELGTVGLLTSPSWHDVTCNGCKAKKGIP